MATIPVVNPIDKRNGIIAAAIVLFLLFLYLYFTTILMADPAPGDIPPVKTETTIEQIELKNLVVESGGAGSGTPTNDPIAEPRPQTQQVLTKPKNPKTQTTSGQSTNNTATNSQHTSSSTQQSNNPFGTGGDGGKGGSGSGGKFGNDQGSSGPGPGGNGSGEGRVRLNDPQVDHIETNVNVIVYLKLTINEDGNVVSAISTSKTTTTDQRIINQVIAAVKNQVKYNKDDGSGLVNVYLTVRINAT